MNVLSSPGGNPGDTEDGRPGSRPERGAEYEYTPLRIPPGTNGASAAVQLTLQAEFGGWELAKVRLHSDGSRRVWLRRPRFVGRVPLPGLSL